jgi:predicted RNase H-like HicB family nuclease
MKTVGEYMKLDYEIVIRTLSEDEGGGWFAYYKDFKGAMGDDENPKEAIDDVTKAFRAFVENALVNGNSITIPSSH